MRSEYLVEQHFHGAYGVDFNKASVEEVLELSHKIFNEGVGYIFPTLVTDTVENAKRQISVIKEAAKRQTSDMAVISGVHLEGIFLNEEKKGIHNSELFLTLCVENYKLLEDDFIKIVTLAPELCEDNKLFEYLRINGVKLQAGHCVGGDLSSVDGVTHLFNAMSGISHRGKSTALSALVDDNIYTEIIADDIHLSADILKLIFRCKPSSKILLISDCLPCTKSNVGEFEFAGKKIYFDGISARSNDGTLAGSTKLLPDIVRLLMEKGLFDKQFVENSYIYHNLKSRGEYNF